ncbi:MAG: aspartate carbamoyltransferase [Candidatus Jettenia sp.]|uniref:Aspartate carbamoyltransferase n=1 Tax=Candidatus Jettenia caeni TaxID=247490 RepID=I3IH98_9BACT|nr:aspartate carbamoyltransferase [Candidatus Jettenia sp. AMX1]MBC6929206.1 aspartate carbamoyltransferase [Candidatus Jettenia sp.]NUN24722.1 aspartate carbamoyltransferase [Candidatus Jettenia caeni]KAA0250163.1 MAG: aspartate carbamoyltransferase [Candidatus Jettenia sp. AMX1]MCE7880561.1 aspartate carbamoyltransferase [Candidatus Jettenia sp. AMX1]MCQ3927362.1 aspartate carbamoyltransferase [Candidatus Jettenia sp.]
MVSFKQRDIISIRHFNKEELLYILDLAKEMERTTYTDTLKDKILASLFFEPSTRTRLSFESAMQRLGGMVIGFADSGITSVAKGESLRDSVKIIEGYCDIIVLRHYLEGSAQLAADVVNIPVINAGDGANQHPTQTFLDLYTIQKTKGALEGLTIGFLGDLKYGRTVHSLAYALAYFGTEMFFISPPGLRMPRDSIDELKDRKVKCYENESLSGISKKLDVIYCTRIQKERFADPVEFEKVRGVYRLSKAMLEELEIKKDLKILHPLPRVDEMDESLDKTNYAVYFHQARNGVPVRKAILSAVLGVIE